jgi:hypothetical protein
MSRPLAVEDDGRRLPDGELRRLRTFWLHVVALALVDQDDEWISGSVSGRNLILDAAGINPSFWDRVMLPVVRAIRTERALAKRERRPPRTILPSSISRRVLRRSGFDTR